MRNVKVDFFFELFPRRNTVFCCSDLDHGMVAMATSMPRVWNVWMAGSISMQRE